VAPLEAFQVREGVTGTLVAALAGDTSVGAAGALEAVTELTKLLNRLKAFTLPMPVAKSHPAVAGYAG
jgi:NAD(P)H-dependent FMN reductase